ncbi:rhodanese-like domain-containing protein [Rheinheimera sp. MMS21-TC3]|uniref:rhodanese-like domain-containing protein n=1 Tax=Rheinheimera sp. MMS21-TC3 TaxID=3072790 RepID=UPI0028C3A8E6|nr:rhodanese-like domain-containing protein [Rheinheimera sp. MMS21-TC3]WNO61177.1 rhodanese-like domain-containing protein [Rheinheimera sp. MMS21-TC3]
MKNLLLVLALILTMFGCTLNKQADQEIWLDVRTAEEFAAGHVINAINIPFDVIEDNIASITTDKNATIYVYCKSGRRAGIALQSLESLGYTNVVNKGGYEELKQSK